MIQELRMEDWLKSNPFTVVFSKNTDYAVERLNQVCSELANRMYLMMPDFMDSPVFLVSNEEYTLPLWYNQNRKCLEVPLVDQYVHIKPECVLSLIKDIYVVCAYNGFNTYISNTSYTPDAPAIQYQRTLLDIHVASDDACYALSSSKQCPKSKVFTYHEAADAAWRYLCHKEMEESALVSYARQVAVLAMLPDSVYQSGGEISSRKDKKVVTPMSENDKGVYTMGSSVYLKDKHYHLLVGSPMLFSGFQVHDYIKDDDFLMKRLDRHRRVLEYQTKAMASDNYSLAIVVDRSYASKPYYWKGMWMPAK